MRPIVAVIGGIGQVFFIQVGGILFDRVGPTSPFVFIGVANLIVMAYAFSVLNASRGGQTGSSLNADRIGPPSEDSVSRSRITSRNTRP